MFGIVWETYHILNPSVRYFMPMYVPVLLFLGVAFLGALS